MSNTSPALGTPPVPARPLLATRAASDTPAPVRTGHCQCGRISYQVTGIPNDPHLCSCVHETRISGGPAVLWVGFPLDSLIWTGTGGEPKWYSTYVLRTSGASRGQVTGRSVLRGRGRYGSGELL